MAWSEESRRSVGRLVEGNREFVREFEASVAPAEAPAVLSAAHPFAVVLSCSDSRVPPEIVLDQDIGDLFVVRIAGNAATSPAVASVEYAVATWGCPLVLVLGHTQCGAVAAAMDPPPAGAAVSEGSPAPDAAGLPHLASLLVEVRSNIAGMVGGRGARSEGYDRWRVAVEANTRRTAESLGQRSSALHRRLEDGSLSIVPAVYEVETGRVRLLDEG